MSKERIAERDLDCQIEARVFGHLVQHAGIPAAYLDSRELMSDAAAEMFAKAFPLAPPMRRPRKFSSEIAAAWQVVAWMRENAPFRFKNLWLVAYCYNRTFATFDAKKGISEEDWSEGNGEHATPLAICLAALDALESAATEKAQLNESVSRSLPDTPRE